MALSRKDRDFLWTVFGIVVGVVVVTVLFTSGFYS